MKGVNQMKYLSNLKINWILKFLILAVLIGGCAAVHKPLKADLTNQTSNITAFSIIPKNEISINIKAKQYTSGGGGLLWIIVDAAINKERDRRAQNRITPLLEATANVDFQTQYWNELEKALAGSHWLKIKHLDKRTVGYTKKDEKAAIMHPSLTSKEANMPETPPFLVLQTFYALSSDSQILFVQTAAYLYLNNPKEPDYFGFHTYYSDKVGKDDEDDEKAIALWSANNAELYRKALAEGIEQNISMLQLDLLGNPANPETERGEKIRINIYNIYADFSDTVKGHTLSRTKNRILMREKDGNLLSIPSGFEK